MYQLRCHFHYKLQLYFMAEQLHFRTSVCVFLCVPIQQGGIPSEEDVWTPYIGEEDVAYRLMRFMHTKKPPV